MQKIDPWVAVVVSTMALTSLFSCRYFLLQRCWQFVATERPDFSTITSDLTHMAAKPTRHIILKSTKDPAKPGYISDNGQVFLRALPAHTLEDDGPPQKRTQRSSGTLRSLISSIDDTVYTRETAETVLDLTQSETENENFNNYERYLKGDLIKSVKRRSYEETDTSGNDVNYKERTRSTSPRKSSKSTSHEGTGENADTASAGRASGTSSSKKRKKRSVGSRSGSKKKSHKSPPGAANMAFSPTDLGEGGEVGVAPPEDSGDVSSNGAPSTEEEQKDMADGDISGMEDTEGSQSELVRL